MNNPATLTDPSGENPFVAAALLGGTISGGINVAAQLITMQPQSLSQALRCMDWGQAGIAFAAGAVAGITGFGIFGGITAMFAPGLMTNVAAGALAGVISGQYARLTELVLSGHTDQIKGTLFQPKDLVLDSVLGGIGGAISYGLQRGLSGIAEDIMQRLTNSANRRLGANLELAETVLSADEYLAGQTSSSVARMEYGNAIERMVSQQIKETPVISGLYKHVGGPNNPDFIGTGLFNGLKFDITTNTTRSISSHLSRAYGRGLIIATYTRPVGFGVFP